MAGNRRDTRVPIDGGFLAVTDVGAGPPVLLLHGSRSDRSWADSLIERLSLTYRCLAPDRHGAGESTGPTGKSDPNWDTLAADVLTVVRWAGAARPLVAGAS